MKKTLILTEKFIMKNKGLIILFFRKLKKQLSYNAEISGVLLEFSKTGKISLEDGKKIKTIVADIFKMFGLGTLFILPIPGSTLFVILLMKTAKRFNIDLIPTKFKNDEL